MRAVYELLKIALGVAAGAGFVVVLNTNFHIYDGSGAKAVSMSYADLAALNLTVASLVLGAVALIVGLFAVFGFQVIRTESVSNAEKHVLKEMPQMIETELRKMEKNGGLSRAMERAIYSGGPENDDGSGTTAEN